MKIKIKKSTKKKVKRAAKKVKRTVNRYATKIGLRRKKNPAMTYGKLPRYQEYSEAFDREVPDGIYEIRRDKRMAIIFPKTGGNVNLDKEQLWGQIVAATLSWENYGDEKAGDWASTVLSTLGFEWI